MVQTWDNISCYDNILNSTNLEKTIAYGSLRSWFDFITDYVRIALKTFVVREKWINTIMI